MSSIPSGLAGVSLPGSVLPQTTLPAASSAAVGATAPDSQQRDSAFAAFAQAILAALNSAAGAPAAGSTAAPAGVGATASVTAVAQALESAVTGSATGSDPVPGLIATIKSALATASAALTQQGVAGDAVSGYATDFETQLATRLFADSQQAPSATPTPAGGVPPPATVPVAASYRIVDRERIDLVTQQGDLVQIRLRGAAGIGATAPGASGSAALAAYGAVSGFSNSQFSVSVSGNLNANELAAINSVLGQVDTIAQQFFSGDLAQAFASAATLGFDPTEIASVGIRLSQTQSLAIATAPAATGTATPATSGSTPPAPTPATTPTTPVTTTTPTVTTPTLPSAAPSTPVAPTDGTTAAAPAAGTTGGTTAPSAATIFQTVTDFIRQLFASLDAAPASGTGQLSARATLQLIAAAIDGAKIGGSSVEVRASAFFASIVQSTVDPAAPSGTGAGTAPATQPPATQAA